MAEIELKPHQEQFFLSKAKFPCLDGGWGNGKSTAGILKLGDHCQRYPGTKVGIFRQDLTDLRRATLDDWKSIFGEFGTWKSDESTFYFNNGSRVLFHQLSELSKLQNHNLSAALIEQAEETNPEAFWMLFGRLRRTDADHRWLGILSNPEGHDWIWKLWIKGDIPEPDRKTQAELDEIGVAPPNPDDFHYICADTYSNKDNLPDDFLASLSNLPRHQFEKYVMGNRDIQRGAIYPMLDERIHLIEPFEVDPNWPKWFTLDYGSKNPTAGLWVTMDFQERIYVYREHYKKQGDDGKQWLISQHSDAIKQQEQDKGCVICPYIERIPDRKIDPACRAKILESNKTMQKLSVMEEFAKNGLHFSPWKRANNPNDKVAQINNVGELLTPKPDFKHPITGESPAPQLYFFRNCINTWEEHTQYKWKEQSPQTIGKRDAAEKPKKLNDHSCDALMGFLATDHAPPNQKKVAPPGSFYYIRSKLIAEKRRSGGAFTFSH